MTDMLVHIVLCDDHVDLCITSENVSRYFKIPFDEWPLAQADFRVHMNFMLPSITEIQATLAQQTLQAQASEGSLMQQTNNAGDN